MGRSAVAELIEHLFLPAFGGTALVDTLTQLGDAALLDVAGGRLAFTTDSYVVRPRFFPSGNVGDLAVNGTVNDLAVSGAVPLALSVGMILEEDAVGRVGRDRGDDGARGAGRGVSIVTGDTKVVDAGHGDGVYINTAGIGVVPAGVDLGPHRVRPGDAVLLSGPIGMHGVAVLSVRDGLEFGSRDRDRQRRVGGLVAELLAAAPGVAMMRDPTRGGVAATLNEVASSSGCRDRDRRTFGPGARGRPRGLRFPGSGPTAHRERGETRGFRAGG